MSNAFFKVPVAKNEPLLSYAPGSPEKAALKSMLKTLKSTAIEVPMTIGGKKIMGEGKIAIHPPHERSHTLGWHGKADAELVNLAINAALEAKKSWENMAWQDRAAIFLKAADLLSGPYRAKMNAATMLAQSKNAFQAEIDAVAELCDFWRYNVQYMLDVYNQQPESSPGVWNRLEYRPLEGFVFALTPFNFTSIAGNLCGAPALMGNTVVWKPADTQIYSAAVIMEILEEAGLPAGVINLVFVDGKTAGEVIFNHADFAGLHFTGSTGVFQTLWKTIGNNISNYKSYPRIVGETGGKDFVVAHSSANAKQVAVALSRGAFEFQGQKCSAASRAYIPKNLWADVKKYLLDDLANMKMGTPEDFTNFINAVIDEKAFDKISSYIAKAKTDKNVEIIAGGNFDKSKGFFIEPTVIVAEEPHYVTMCEEIFGPVLTIYVYEPKQFEKTLELVDTSSPYALTGAVLSRDREATNLAIEKLRNSAGNFYINDKPTGAVVGQQPFGGARASGTNDKAGSVFNLLRWVSPRTIKESFVPATDFRYPFLNEE
ncbi:MAG: L-glutamate gamma-semialdehyde dehydrogenase [Saprospiraceae bacterium]|nr:L-glutamate gamma-semialdehyde dehydrogenase [Saprospiraceae bacterium]MCF8249297.1 L-glutamate gamma-semialdehyde dehydrogenase [Saprospiraceae bacterium]MCF8279718.1 L-glutamate gamma-semialdehyde dehydrogenase [Bacteroidales bacterium]MCF8311426.1 L-glutamate gamma-semialdehyde dehydrogenase [Saprospiraceae bacterium]MCF8439916.1 L-glutamate gamma-semialdehyde dehydrogenase [Saprospiraceae bacterium]